MTTKEILFLIAPGVVVVVGGFWLIQRKIRNQKAAAKHRQDGTTEGATEKPAETKRGENSIAGFTETPEEKISEILEKSQIDETLPVSDRLTTLADGISDSDVQNFLRDIAKTVQETGPCFDAETPHGFIEEMVDRLDDLQAIEKNQSGQTAEKIRSFRNSLIGILSDCGVALIHSDHWDASLQRAIAKEITPGIDAPTILRYGSSGIHRHGQLLRKQEVVLAVPESH